jgi:hydroxymethylbilane synthase
VPSALRLATRGSPLARRQSELVAGRLHALDITVELVIVETLGDMRRDVPMSELAGQGVFTTEVDRAVLEDRADVAVHSAKDLPSSVTVAGLTIAAVPERADPRDALVGSSLEDLPPGAVVATGSPRRRVQLSNVRPDLAFSELRGNIGTRLERVPPGGSVVVAAAALDRLSLGSQATELLPVSVMLPQVGQGAIALRCRDGDDRTIGLLAEIDDVPAHRALRAERAFLGTLGGGCDAPVGAYATVDETGIVYLEAMLASLDGHIVIRRRASGVDPEETGSQLAVSMVEIDVAGELFGLA